MSSMRRSMGLLLFGALLGLGCKLGWHNPQFEDVRLLTYEKFPSKHSAEEVQILPELPKETFIEIALITIEGRVNGSMVTAIDAMRSKAAELGADALIQLQTSWREVHYSGYSPSLQTDYGMHPTPGISQRDMVQGQQVPRVRARAIRFQREEKKP